MREALARFEAAAGLEETRTEARVRGGWILFQRQRFADALEWLGGAPPKEDRELGYWHGLFRGRVLDALDRPQDALSAYQAAHALYPDAQSAGIKRGGADGTAFFDAVSLAMVTIPTPERRQITIVLSDARDNHSFFDEKTMQDAASRTDAVVYMVLPGSPSRGRAVSVARLQALSLLTGGRLVLTHETAVGSVIIDAIEEFRQSYVVRYELAGVARGGWHKVDVRVRGGYRVRAKPGYFPR